MIAAANNHGAHDAVRRTALVLHALAPADRSWILERLPERNREQVMPCLSELETLGIPREPWLAMGPGVSHETSPPDGGEEIHLRDVRALADALRQEPVRLVALALKGREPGLRDAVVMQLPEPMRERVRQQMRARDAEPMRLGEAIEIELQEKLSSDARSAPSRPTLVRRWHAGWLRITGVLG